MQLDSICVDLIEEHIRQGCPFGIGLEHPMVVRFRTMSREQWDLHVRYLQCRKEGTSPNLAEMFALAQPPQSKTDVEFLRGTDKQFSEGPLANKMGDHLKRIAESQGQCTKGKVYKGGLAAYPGDPRAWVSDRSEVQKVLEERNWSSTGDVEHKADNSRESFGC